MGNSGILANESNINEEEHTQVGNTIKSLPYLYTKEDKDEILKKLNDIDADVKQSFKNTITGALIYQVLTQQFYFYSLLLFQICSGL